MHIVGLQQMAVGDGCVEVVVLDRKSHVSGNDKLPRFVIEGSYR